MFRNAQPAGSNYMAYFSSRPTSTKPPKAGAAFNALKRDIMLGTLAPGTGLTELELAAHFQCSQGTVREALLQLQEEGLVRRQGHRGTQVSECTEDEAIACDACAEPDAGQGAQRPS
jgi:DNA-binding GntR family transcriptional regulator